MEKFALGDQVKDKITGFTGTVTARAEYIGGQVTYLVEAPMIGAEKRSDWIDQARLEIVK